MFHTQVCCCQLLSCTSRWCLRGSYGPIQALMIDRCPMCGRHMRLQIDRLLTKILCILRLFRSLWSFSAVGFPHYTLEWQFGLGMSRNWVEFHGSETKHYKSMRFYDWNLHIPSRFFSWLCHKLPYTHPFQSKTHSCLTLSSVRFPAQCTWTEATKSTVCCTTWDNDTFNYTPKTLHHSIWKASSQPQFPAAVWRTSASLSWTAWKWANDT